MATISEANQLGPDRLRPEKGPFDRYIDLQYFDVPIELQSLDVRQRGKACAEEPWKYCTNPVHGYLSSRQGKLDEFEKEMKEADRDKWDRVQRETTRIAALNKRFRENELKKSLMEELDGCYQALRRRLHGDTPRRRGPVHRRLIKSKDYKQRNTKPASPQQLNGKTPPDEAADQHENMKSEGLNSFKAAVMYFNRTGSDNPQDGFPHSAYRAEYPIQKFAMWDILSDSEQNPLRHNGEVLRYFHFPANNMEWIEVSFFFLHREHLMWANQSSIESNISTLWR